MPNARTHMLVGAGVTTLAALADKEKSEVTHNIVMSPLIGALGAKLPDMLEPALHPNHRQFFHSVSFLAAMSAGLYKVYKWSPDDPLEKLIRGVLLLGGVAYASHLLCDATTPKSLPLVGKL